MIVCFVDIGGIVDYHCLEVIVCFVDIGGIVGHHCLEVIVRFVDIGGIVDRPCLEMIFHFVDIGVNYQPSLPKLSFHNFTAISTPPVLKSMPLTYVVW